MKPEKIFFKPAPYTRDGSNRPRVVYHPRRAGNPAVRLADEGEVVSVRPSERLHWKRLELAGDVIRSSPSKTSKTSKTSKPAAEKAAKGDK